jgi:hypothetical protein
VLPAVNEQVLGSCFGFPTEGTVECDGRCYLISFSGVGTACSIENVEQVFYDIQRIEC